MKFKSIILIIVSIMIAVSPVFGAESQKRIEIFGSVLGAMADPARWGEFSCINQDGTLNGEKYRYYMKTFRALGATATRELPYLVHDDKKTVTPNYMPYVFVDGKYDLARFNEQYFTNLAEMARIANGQGIVFYLSLFDTGGHGNFPNQPWRLNHQNIDRWYGQGDLAKQLRIRWVKKVLETLIGKYVVGFELGNEVRNENFPEIAVDIMTQLRAADVPLWRIIMGAEFILSDKVEGNTLYRKTKNALKKLKQWDKRQIFSKVVHGAYQWFFQKYWYVQKHWSRFFVGDDGLKPKKNATWWENVLTPYFKAVKLSKNKFLIMHAGIEHVYRFKEDDIFGVFGIAKALENAYDIKMYSQTPDQLTTTGDDISVDAGTSDTAEGFKIVKKKWYELVWEILKAIYEVLTGKK